MSGRRIAPILSLLRQGLSVEFEFGTHSLEAMLWVAETVERAVYREGSLRATAGGLAFTLGNPPLRMGSFSRLRAEVDGVPVRDDDLRVRVEPDLAWRSAASVSVERPLTWVPGARGDFEVTRPGAAEGRETRVRLELESMAIPPTVWLEFRDRVAPAEAGTP